MYKITFNSKGNSFYQDLKSSVDQYFTIHQLSRTGNLDLYLKAFVLVPAAIGLYLILLFLHMPLLTGILISGIFGFILACIGFNVMHDACHGAYSKISWVNNLMGLSLNLLGGNAFIWKFKHNIIHHTYTNIDGMDDDIAKSPAMRMCSSQVWTKAHHYQHIYVLFLYAISSFLWVSLMDFNKYFKKRVLNAYLQKMSWQEHTIFWLSKIFYLIVYIGIPVHFAGWQAWAIGFSSMHIVMGFTLALVFQLAHVVENTEFVFAPGIEPQKIEEAWAIHQVVTTADFAPRNKIISWLVGGLNYQIEHHLFPKVSHIHYPSIAPIVKQVCLKYHLQYNEFNTMRAAIASHFRILKLMGEKPVTAS